MAGIGPWRPPAPSAPTGYQYNWGNQTNPHGSYTLGPAGGGAGTGSGLPGMGGAGGGTSGLPGGGNLAQLQSLFASMNKPGPNVALPAPPQLQGGNSQYLAELRALMAKMGQGGLPQLDPSMQAELNARKQAMTGEINRTFNEAMGSTTADLYGRGMERGGVATGAYSDVSGRKAQAMSELLSGIFGQETGMRKELGQMQQQGLQGQAGILQQLMGAEEQQKMAQWQMAQQQYQNQLALAQSEQDRRMKQVQMMMQIFQQFPQMAGQMQGMMR